GLAAVLGGCSTPKYASYHSIWGDWRADVPYHWNVMTDHEGTHFAVTNLIGPFEPSFYLGAPSFSVGYHQYNTAHRLPDGMVEDYSSVDDYIAQMLRDVYGPNYELVSSLKGHHHDPQGIDEIYVSGRKAKHFTVLSPTPVPAATKWGTSVNPSTGQLGVVRLHEYAVLPLSKGFYVLVYPATREGFDLYKKQFNALLNSFKVLKEGP
ncbi:MAG: hypothetical protein KGK30_07505, partial [Elusimicrobia bacterium]|nr:hypothetical protein [Elusimicrobiota bacterium]